MRLSRNASRSLVGIVLIPLATACDSDIVKPDHRGDSMPPHLMVAQSLSLALADVNLRHSLRDEMRDSPWTQHKLILQEFLEADRGRALLLSAAKAAGVSVPEFVSALELLPLMDFYVPNREQRLTWTGSPAVMVGIALDDDAPAYVTFGREGNPGIVSRQASRRLSQTLLLLHPEEPKGQRFILPNEADSETIQTMWKEPYYLRVTTTEADGSVTERQVLAGYGQDHRSEGASYLVQNAYLRLFDADFNDSGDCEVIYRARLYAANGSTVKIVETEDHDFPCPNSYNYASEDSPLFNGHYLMDLRPSLAGEEFHMRVMEDDSFNNDDYGSQYWTSAHDEVNRGNTHWQATIGW